MEQYKGFDFVRLVTVDFYGRARGRLMPAWKVKDFLKNGSETGTAMQAYGPLQEMEEDVMAPLMSVGFPNSIWRGDEATLAKIPWSKTQFNVGEIICESYGKDGKIEEAFNPRHVLRKQLQGLEKLGFLFKSAFEVEFTVFDAKTLEPTYPGARGKWLFNSVEMLAQVEPFLCSVSAQLYKAGVFTDKLEVEFAQGQLEMTFKPEIGMKTADDMFRVRQCLREVSKDHNIHVTFMAKPHFIPHCYNGCHLNFSLCSLGESRENVLYDASKDELTETGRHFLGGIIAHLDALMSFICPTINCYRRIANDDIRSAKDWDFENRMMSFRCCKGLSEHGMRIEFRLVSTMANPYLAMAATISAGRDGIERKLEPPVKGQREERVVDSLAQALSALEKDDVIIDSMGKEFVEWWVRAKRAMEVKQMGHHHTKDNTVEELDREKLSYFFL